MNLGKFVNGKIRYMPTVEVYLRKHLRFNFIVGLLDGGFFGLGIGFGSFTAVLPLFVNHLTSSALLIGLVPAIHNMGWQLPQLFTAGWISRAKRFKPIMLWMTIHERVPFLGLAVIAMLIPRISTAMVLALTFLMLIWQGLGGGLAANPWTNMISKVIPRGLHGTFFGAQSAAFNGFAGISAVIAGLILDRVMAPMNFSLCFLLTFIAMAISYMTISFTREPETPPRETGQPIVIWGRAREILRQDRNFRTFLLVRILSQFAGMAFAFYIIYGVQVLQMSDAAAGVMVAILLIGQVILGPLMGRWSDRWNPRGVMAIGALCASLSAVLAWRATSVDWFYPILLLEAVAVVAIWTIPLAFSISFARQEEDRPLYIGMANTVPAPAAILAPVIGGWLADGAGFQITFILSAICGLLMAAVLWLRMKSSGSHIKGTDG